MKHMSLTTMFDVFIKRKTQLDNDAMFKTYVQ